MTEPISEPTIHLERPPHGGSFIRQEDGSLLVVESAIPKAADTPVPSTSPPTVAGDLPHIDTPAPAGQQHEG